MTNESRLPSAVDHFSDEGEPPALCETRPLEPSRPVTELFSDGLAGLGAGPLPELPGTWRALTVEQATVLLALRRHRTQAYGITNGAPADHLSAARALLDALEAHRAWTNTDVLNVVDPQTLAFPPGGYGYGLSFLVTSATFETLVLVEGRRHALLAVWTDED